MNDFEDRLRKALNAKVDSQLGERRPAPPFRADRRPAGRRGRRAPWVMPAIAAACVAAAVGGTVRTTRLLADDHAPAVHPPTVSRSVIPSTVAPTQQSSPAPSSAVPTQSTVSSPPEVSTTAVPPPAGHVVTLGAAQVYLPEGWVARDLQRYMSPGASPLAPGWCLTPRSTPVRQDDCPIRLGVVDPKGNPVDVDTEGGFSSNPEYCFPQVKSASEQYGDRTLGSRAADWRRWRFDCRDGRRYDIEQYVVPTMPAYVLFTQQAGAVHDAMTEIGQRSTLPPPAGGLRLMDRGVVRSVQKVTGGLQISLDRAIRTVDGYVNHNPAIYEYRIPNSVLLGTRTPPEVGQRFVVFSDGREVTSAYAEP